ncbi:MAG: acetolactate synthase-1/3 small subunit [Saprospiraceae bacterium]|jgi:acetolactate synthase-1/3 small subunit
MRRIIAMLMENESGALSRVAGLFSARAYNIESLTVAATEDPTLSRLTLVTIGDDNKIEQILKQINKLIDVVKVVDLSASAHIEREVVLLKVIAKGNEQREEVKRLVDIFDSHIVDVSDTTYTIQMIGDADQTDAFISAMQIADIVETARSGVTGIARGKKGLKV